MYTLGTFNITYLSEEENFDFQNVTSMIRTKKCDIYNYLIFLRYSRYGTGNS